MCVRVRVCVCVCVRVCLVVCFGLCFVCFVLSVTYTRWIFVAAADTHSGFRTVVKRTVVLYVPRHNLSSLSDTAPDTRTTAFILQLGNDPGARRTTPDVADTFWSPASARVVLLGDSYLPCLHESYARAVGPRTRPVCRSEFMTDLVGMRPVGHFDEMLAGQRDLGERRGSRTDGNHAQNSE